MPTFTTRHRKWIPRAIRRGGAMAFHPQLVADTISNQTDGDIIANLNGFPDHPDIDFPALPIRFAFWAIQGAGTPKTIKVIQPGYTGDYVTTKNPCPPVHVGTKDIVATAWYVVDDSNAQGLQVDAFDLDLGDFVNDDFVEVAPDANLTAAANQNGFIPTTNTEHALAFAQIQHVPFSEWKVFYGTPGGSIFVAPQHRDDLTANAGSAGIAFAFFRTPKPSFIVPAFDRELGYWVSYGVTVDGGGPTGNGPVDPWNPMLRDIAAALALAQLADKLAPELRAKTLEISVKQVELAAGAITRRLDAERKKPLEDAKTPARRRR